MSSVSNFLTTYGFYETSQFKLPQNLRHCFERKESHTVSVDRSPSDSRIAFRESIFLLSLECWLFASSRNRIRFTRELITSLIRIKLRTRHSHRVASRRIYSVRSVVSNSANKHWNSRSVSSSDWPVIRAELVIITQLFAVTINWCSLVTISAMCFIPRNYLQWKIRRCRATLFFFNDLENMELEM